jgi:hypothetical protein
MDTHPPLFTEAGEPFEADHWLQVTKSKFGLLRCTEVQKTLFTAQQLHVVCQLHRHSPRGLPSAMG